MAQSLNENFKIQPAMNTKGVGILALFAAVAIMAVAGVEESGATKTATYEVTVTNITPGQPITPPLLVTHTRDAGFFTVGQESGEQLQQLAENGNTEPLVQEITGKKEIFDIVQGTAPLVPANDPGRTGLAYSETFTISAGGAHRYLSFASMLVCTNDGFAGVDGIRLPYYHEKTVYAKAYDARTEANTEDFADLVPPCQDAIGISSDDEGTGISNPALSEDGVIIPHPGIMGTADLSSVHMWSNPVVKIDIIRVE